MKRSLIVVSVCLIAILCWVFRPKAEQSIAPTPSSHSNDSKKPIIIAHVPPVSGRFSADSEADRRGVQMAIDKFNAKGGCLGREIVLILRDPTEYPDKAAKVARELIVENKISFMVGAIHSGVAAAMSKVCQEYGVIFINTNSSSPAESGINAHRSKFVFDANGANFARALIDYALVNRKSKRVLLLTEDYDWGHSNAAAARPLIKKAGGTVVGEVIIAEKFKDTKVVLAKIAAIPADVVVLSVSGSNQTKLFSQVTPEVLRDQLWLLNQADWPALYNAPGTMRPLFGTTWAWNLDTPGTAEFVAEYRQRYGKTTLDYPGNVVHMAYLATMALLTSIERAGTTDNHAIIKELENYKWTAKERMQHTDAYIDPVSHHVQQCVYIAQWDPTAKRPQDGIKIIGRASPETVSNEKELKETRLESLEDTKHYAP
ncbi:MAG: amino acid ABC transporter substrate-binding protein [Lentisphaeria bacterium]|nr:ABC transporter substrate-binding protein [Lentisphaeria bacterium]NQZ68516.1 amino acid ABC transporter substrate-binding protein [Lentisphaeria bacterium]